MENSPFIFLCFSWTIYSPKPLVEKTYNFGHFAFRKWAYLNTGCTSSVIIVDIVIISNETCAVVSGDRDMGEFLISPKSIYNYEVFIFAEYLLTIELLANDLVLDAAFGQV